MNTELKTLKIGTRGSKLALWQAHKVQSEIARTSPERKTEIVIIRTSGDWKPSDGEKPLDNQGGGKALFAKEIEEALLGGTIDVGVHSMKDMDSTLPDGLVIDHMLPREDPRDAFIINSIAKINQSNFTIPSGITIGTVSPRRSAFLREHTMDINITPLRGNVPTRLLKLKNGDVDATVLAVSGLKRLGLEHEISHIMDVDFMLPCAGQGAVGIEMRKDDSDIADILSTITCTKTVLEVKTERSVLKELGGSCHTPIGVYAVLNECSLHVRAKMSALDGYSTYTEDRTDNDVHTIEKAIHTGQKIGKILKERVPASWL